jgi:IS30 family transposase
MGKRYRQLTYHDRNVIQRMLTDRCSKAKIAKHLGVHVSTIYREVNRNKSAHPRTGKTYYESYFAHKRYLGRRSRECRLETDHKLRKFVFQKLKQKWSPQQIEWHLKNESGGKCIISHESIYTYIYGHWKRRFKFHSYLRRQHKSRIKQSSRKSRFAKSLMIHARPEVANNRSEFGHWECDLMVFKRGIKHNLITLVERQTRFTLAIKNSNRQSVPTALAIIRTLSPIKRCVKSITFDQGVEFSQYSWISECLNADIYFCEPASPYQKGSIENRNGVIRTVYGRSCDIISLSQHRLDKELAHINARPMLCLDFASPQTLFERQVDAM